MNEEVKISQPKGLVPGSIRRLLLASIRLAFCLAVTFIVVSGAQYAQYSYSVGDDKKLKVDNWLGEDSSRQSIIDNYKERCLKADPEMHKIMLKDQEKECAKEVGAEDYYEIISRDSHIKTFAWPLSEW